jgi:hypothetical protein
MIPWWQSLKKPLGRLRRNNETGCVARSQTRIVAERGECRYQEVRERCFATSLLPTRFRPLVSSFIPIYPITLVTVPKPSRAGRTLPLVFSDLPASQSAITRLENR